jgi:hypothetical protein
MEKTTKTATEKYNEFIAAHGSDISALSPELVAKFGRLATAKAKEEKPTSTDEATYKEMCDRLAIARSAHFHSFIKQEKPNGTVVAGIKYTKDGRTKYISANVKPSEKVSEGIVAEQEFAAKVLDLISSL